MHANIYSNEASAEPDRRVVLNQRSSTSSVNLNQHSTSTLASAALTIHCLGMILLFHKSIKNYNN